MQVDTPPAAVERAGVARNAVERLTLGLIALVLALIGGVSVGAVDRSGPSDRLSGRIAAELPRAEPGLATEQRLERRSGAALSDGADPVLTVWPAPLRRSTISGTVALFPVEIGAPARPPLLGPRVATGPPSPLPV